MDDAVQIHTLGRGTQLAKWDIKNPYRVPVHPADRELLGISYNSNICRYGAAIWASLSPKDIHSSCRYPVIHLARGGNVCRCPAHIALFGQLSAAGKAENFRLSGRASHSHGGVLQIGCVYSRAKNGGPNLGIDIIGNRD